MIVTKESFGRVVESLSRPGQYSLDTETHGVEFYDRLFSIIIASADDTYYFNFNTLPDHNGRLPPEEHNLSGKIALMAPIFGRVDSLFFIHNAKFDMQKLRLEGLAINGKVHCTMAIERLIYNHYLEHSMDACAKRRGMEKDKSVEDYIKKFGIYGVNSVGEKKPLYAQVPFFIMANYAELDGRLAYFIGQDQRRDLDVAAN